SVSCCRIKWLRFQRLSFRHMSEAKEEEPASLQKNARTEHGNVEFPKLCHSDRRGGTCCLQHYQRGRLGGPSLFFPHLKLWLPRPCVLCKGGYDAADSTSSKPAQAFDLTYFTTTVAAPSFAYFAKG